MAIITSFERASGVQWIIGPNARDCWAPSRLPTSLSTKARSAPASSMWGCGKRALPAVVHISEMQSLLARFYALDPDVILIDLENPKRDVLEQIFQVSRAVRRPIPMFVDQTQKRTVPAGRVLTVQSASNSNE